MSNKMIKISGNVNNMTMVKIVDRESGLVWKPIRLRDLLTNECWGDMWSETDEEGDAYSLPIKDWRQDCDFDNCDITIYNEGDIDED